MFTLCNNHLLSTLHSIHCTDDMASQSFDGMLLNSGGQFASLKEIRLTHTVMTASIMRLLRVGAGFKGLSSTPSFSLSLA